MDLVEHRGSLSERHPWEQSRARAIVQILDNAGIRHVDSILDYGCGDAYTGRFLLEWLQARSLTGVDVNLSDEQCRAFAEDERRMTLTPRESDLGEQRFGLILLCDVIEHVEDDQTLLAVARRRLAPGGHLVVTVPAFQKLFTDHDRMLKHFRRYSRSELEGSLTKAGLSVRGSGYLFGSLLPVRASGKAVELVRGARTVTEGVGDWRGGARLTKVLSGMFDADNSLLLALSRRGLNLPGLSAWALCRSSE